MPNVVLFPAAGRSVENFRRTVINPVLLADATRFLDRQTLEAIERTHPDQAAPMWGTWTGADGRFVRKWERVRPGDVVAFSGDGGLVASAVVTHKFRSRQLASHVWDDLVKNNTVYPYELMVTLRDLQDVFVSYPAVRNAIASWGPNATVREMNVYEGADAAALLRLLLRPNQPAARPPTLGTAPGQPDEIPAEEISVTSYEIQRTDEMRPAALRREAILVRDYAAWLALAGRESCRHRVPMPEGGHLYTDLFDKATHELIEAKANSRREAIRMGLGQLMDYKRNVPHRISALLLPERPVQDLLALLDTHGVNVIWRSGNGFARHDAMAS